MANRATKKLDHSIPNWVPNGAVYFITICCADRGKNSLAKPEIAEQLLVGLKEYQRQNKWWIHIALIMPDHLHILLTFSPSVTLKETVVLWKRFQTRFLGINWQSDFFEHRIRSNEQLSEKYEYIRQNPVRKNLVSKPNDWPYVWSR